MLSERALKALPEGALLMKSSPSSLSHPVIFLGCCRHSSTRGGGTRRSGPASPCLLHHRSVTCRWLTLSTLPLSVPTGHSYKPKPTRRANAASRRSLAAPHSRRRSAASRTPQSILVSIASRSHLTTPSPEAAAKAMVRPDGKLQPKLVDSIATLRRWTKRKRKRSNPCRLQLLPSTGSITRQLSAAALDRSLMRHPCHLRSRAYILAARGLSRSRMPTSSRPGLPKQSKAQAAQQTGVALTKTISSSRPSLCRPARA